MNYLISALSNVLNAIRKRKGFFSLLILVQFCLLVAAAAVGLHYQLQILTDVQGVLQPMEGIDLTNVQNPEQVLPEIGKVYSSYLSLKSNLLKFGGWILVLALFVNALLWLGAHRMFYAYSWADTLGQLKKYLVSALVIFGPFFLISYLVLRSQVGSFDITAVSDTLTILGVILIFLYYLFLLGASVLPISLWKRFTGTIFKSIIPALLVLAVTVFLNAAIAYGVYISVMDDWPFFSMMLLIILFIFSLVFTKLYWVACAHENYT